MTRSAQFPDRPATRLPFPTYFLLSASVLVGACAIGSSNTYPAHGAVRPLMDLPEAFVPADSTAAAGAGQSGCLVRLSDPRDRSLLILRNSQGRAIGDYESQPGRYGLRDKEYLRVDCRTLRPLGAVPGPS